MPKIDIAAVPARKVRPIRRRSMRLCSTYAAAFGRGGRASRFRRQSDDLPPGSWSSHQDELVYVLEGEVTLIEDGGETVSCAGDCATFPKGTGSVKFTNPRICA